MTFRPIGAALLLLGCAAPEPPPADYVGRAVCASCHATADSAYAGSDHDLAMAPATDSAVLGDFSDVTLTHRGDTTAFFRRGSDFYVRIRGAGGAPEELRIEATFGARPLQQYLVALPGGRLQRLPWSWDTRPVAEGGQRWFPIDSADSIEPTSPLHWTRLGGRWNTMCADCHSTGLRRNYDRSSDSYRTSWTEIDVSCEACHGPGSRHLAWAKSSAPGDTARGFARSLRAGGTWVRAAAARIATLHGEPATADARAAQSETCARCHSYRTVLQEGGAELAFDDAYALRTLEDGLYFADGQAREEVFVYGSFLQSRMYRAGVVCGDCHEPHSGGLRRQGDGLCLGCHSPDVYAVTEHHRHPAGTPGSRCVDCHMPSRIYMQVDARRDHVFNLPRPDVAGRVGAPDPCTSCHSGRSPAWAARTIERWRGAVPGRRHFAEVLRDARAGNPAARPGLIALTADTAVGSIVRATAVELLSRYAGRDEVAAGARALGDTSALVRAAGVRALAPLEGVDPKLLRPLLDDAALSVRLEAARALVGRTASLDDRARGRLEAVLGELIASRLLTADVPSARLDLGQLYEARGEPGKAEAEYRAALTLEPGFAPSYVVLATLLEATGRPADALATLELGVTRAGRDPTLRYALGLALARAGRPDSALAQLEAAARSGPERSDLAVAFAVALNGQGRRRAARATLEGVLVDQPWDPDARFLLSSILRDEGDRAGALRHAEALTRYWPAVPEYQRLVAVLGPEGR